ncbi:MAG TPA: nitroreductase [Syntrophales bacterium]|nr:nitroreductase [Syntrophales bacterium]HNS53455.1 nitroreductase [Syntrophales bacterium]HQL90561.1 nitroreductase [Syntrophales bacterium]
MELEAAVRGRRSIRKFSERKVPGILVEEILEAARWAPSWGNTQPWEFTVLTGAPLEAFREANERMFSQGLAAAPDIPMPESWPAALKARYGELGRTMLDLLGIDRADQDARNRLYARMAGLFGAPCLIVAAIPRGVAVEYAMLDVGLVVQTICLLAHARGLGTCIMAAAVRYPDALRKVASIPDDRRIVAAVAVGYPDPEYPLNRFERKRADLREIVRWVD